MKTIFGPDGEVRLSVSAIVGKTMFESIRDAAMGAEGIELRIIASPGEEAKMLNGSYTLKESEYDIVYYGSDHNSMVAFRDKYNALFKARNKKS